MNIPQKFLNKISKTGTCWLWTGHINNCGYGRYSGDNLHSKYAHRIMFYMHNGYLPKYPRVVGHTCNVRNCVNPEHLIDQSQSDNVKQYTKEITHCPKGHPYSPENTYIRPSGARKCRECHRINETKRRGK